MNKKVLLILPFLFLCGCKNKGGSSESISQDSAEVSSFESSDSPSISLNSSSSSQSSSSKESSSSTSSKSSSSNTSTNVSSTKGNSSSNVNEDSSKTSSALTKDEAISKLKEAIKFDDNLKSYKANQYFIYKTYYQKQLYETTRYSNNLTLIKGTTSQTYLSNYQKIEGNYIEQKNYADGTYYDIRKFDDNNKSYQNKAYKEAMTEENALENLKLKQASDAYNTYQNLSGSHSLTFKGNKNEDSSIYASFINVAEASNDYCLAYALEFTLDSSNRLTDFYFTEGYYSAYYCQDLDVKTLRKHGPDSYGGGGTTFEVTNFSYGYLEEYKETLPYSVDDNFVKEISFKQTSLEIKLSSLGNEKYIDLFDYIKVTPDGSLTSGCPVNNIVFKSSDESVAKTGDRSEDDNHYLDLLTTGEVNISAKDKLTGVETSQDLHIVISQ